MERDPSKNRLKLIVEMLTKINKYSIRRHESNIFI